MKIRKERIHDRYVGSPERDASSGLVLGRAMHPHTIEDQMIDWTLKQDEIVNRPREYGARHFQTDQPIIVCTRSKDDGATAGCRHDELGQDVVRRGALKSRSAWQRRHSRIAGRKSRAFRRQCRIVGARADDDPIVAIATLGRKREYSNKRCSGM